MWFRLAIIVTLVFRRWDPGPFSFWPTRHEWRTGVTYFLVSVVPIVAVASLLHAVHYQSPQRSDLWRLLFLGIGTFFAFLWVIALGEELFFRGIITRALLNQTKSPTLAVIASSLLFGSVHLWMNSFPFPNWRWAIVATLLGTACGVAYVRTGSVRAPMVTHALTVATWRLLFQ